MRLFLRFKVEDYESEVRISKFRIADPIWRDQNLERQNIEQPIFRNFKIPNIRITKDELFDNFIFEFNFSFFRNHSNTEYV